MHVYNCFGPGTVRSVNIRETIVMVVVVNISGGDNESLGQCYLASARTLPAAAYIIFHGLHLAPGYLKLLMIWSGHLQTFLSNIFNELK